LYLSHYITWNAEIWNGRPRGAFMGEAAELAGSEESVLRRTDIVIMSLLG